MIPFTCRKKDYYNNDEKMNPDHPLVTISLYDKRNKMNREDID